MWVVALIRLKLLEEFFMTTNRPNDKYIKVFIVFFYFSVSIKSVKLLKQKKQKPINPKLGIQHLIQPLLPSYITSTIIHICGNPRAKLVPRD